MMRILILLRVVSVLLCLAQLQAQPRLGAAGASAGGFGGNGSVRDRTALENRDAAGNAPLHLAALRGDVATVTALLASGAEVNCTNKAGATPLLYGAHNDAMVLEFLRHGADPNIASALGWTPLMAAAVRNRSFTAARALIEHGANIKARRSAEEIGLISGEQPLALAIEGGDPKTINLLIECGATINPARTNEFSSLIGAAFFGDLATARRLLDLGADPNYDGDFAGHALNYALYGDHRDVAALLIQRGSDLHVRSPIGRSTPSMMFSVYNESGDATIASLFIARGIDVDLADASGQTALSWALNRGPNTTAVRALRQAGATDAGPTVRPKEVPWRPLPDGAEARSALVQRETLQLCWRTPRV